MKPLAMIVLSVALAASSGVWAHDETMHKGKGTRGTLTDVRGEQMTLKTDEGPVAVTLTDTTKVAQDDKNVGREALVPGTRAVVFGTKVPGQGLVAKEIVLGETAIGHAEHGGGPVRDKH